MSEWLAWALGVLACWRISHLLWAEEGPAGLVRRLRQALAPTPAGPLFDCFYCLSLWVGGAVSAAVLWLVPAMAPGPGPGEGPALAALVLAWALGALALSGAAILIERLNPGHLPPGHEENEA